MRRLHHRPEPRENATERYSGDRLGRQPSRTRCPWAKLLPTIVGFLVVTGTGLAQGPSTDGPLANQPTSDGNSWAFEVDPNASEHSSRLPLTAPGETLVTQFDFEAENCDVNYDLWPDDWERRTGRGFPNYVNIELSDVGSITAIADQGAHFGMTEVEGPIAEPAPIAPPAVDLGKQALKIELDGGAAEITSPRIPINSHFSYALQGWILLTPSRWEEQNEAWISMTLLNRDGTITQTYRTPRLERVGQWTRVELGPVVPQDPQFQYLTLTLHVHPTRAEDIFGQAWFDNLEILHLPKLNAVVNKPFHFYTTGEQVEVACSVSGMQTNDATLTFQLLDVRRDVILERRLALIRGALRLIEPDESEEHSEPNTNSGTPPSDDDVPDDSRLDSDQQTRWDGPPFRNAALQDSHESLVPASLSSYLTGSTSSNSRRQSRSTLQQQPAEPATIEIAEDIRRDVGDGEWIRWKPEIDQNGYYRVVVVLSNSDGLRLSRELPIVVAPPANRHRSQQFGWNLPRQSPSVSFQSLVELLHDSGVQWVMYPVWYSKAREDEGQRLGELAERITMERMEMIALLDVPPQDQSESFSRVEQGISATLRDREIWLPALEHVLTRLSFKINWWQLGTPDDMSFVGQPSLERKIEGIRESLQRFGKNIRVGYTWNLLHETPWISAFAEDTPETPVSLEPWRQSMAPWDYLLRHHETPLTAGELTRVIEAADRAHGPVWMTLQPLDSEHYDLSTRVRDLVERMVAARVAGADVVMIPEPISSYTGLINDDHSPTELLLPFRTTSFQLADSEYVGQLELPGGSTNFLFRRGTEVMMVVWNDSPTTETLSLGPRIRLFDCWGKQADLPIDAGRATIPISREPRFVTGLEYELVQWQMKTQLDRDLIESAIGKQQDLGVFFQNTMPEGVAGTVTLYCDELWDSPQSQSFKATSAQELELQFPLTLRTSVGTSRQEIVIAFDIQGIQRHRFQVRRTVDVGIKDIRIDTAVQREGDNLLVHATLVNESPDPVSFNLYLFAPDRKRQRTQVLQLETARQRRTFVIENAADLLDKSMWLRAEEMRGSRVLNYRIDGPLKETRE